MGLVKKIKRNTASATQAGTRLANEHAAKVYKEIQKFLAMDAFKDQMTPDIDVNKVIALYLNAKTDLLTRRGNEWTKDRVKAVIKLAEERNL